MIKDIKFAEMLVPGESQFKLGDRINLSKGVPETNEVSGYVTFLNDERVSLAQKHPLNSLLYRIGLVPTNHVGERTYHLRDFNAYEILSP